MKSTNNTAPEVRASFVPLAVGATVGAKMLGVSARTLWALTRDGSIKSFRVGRRVLYRVSDLQDFAAGRVAEGGVR